MRRLVLLAAPIAVLGGLTAAGGHASASTTVGTTNVWVSTTGSDSNPCTKAAPCATLQHAADAAPVGAVIHVEAGTYYQTVNLSKPLTLEGAGVGKTTIDGSKTDEISLYGYYAVIQVSDNTSGTNGTTDIHGLTVQGAYITSAESTNDGASPIDIGVYNDSASADTVNVHDVALNAVADNADYYGIGFYTLNAAPTVSFTDSTVMGNFQGALLEGSGGPAAVKTVHFSNLATGDTTYPPEGVFVLADTSGTSTATVSNNVFSGYAGDGIDAEAGYSGGNCGPPNPPCGGNVNLTASHNSFTLGATTGGAAAAFYLIANSGNTLTGTVTDNHGTVAAPTEGIVLDSRSGIMHVTEHGNNIKQT